MTERKQSLKEKRRKARKKQLVIKIVKLSAVAVIATTVVSAGVVTIGKQVINYLGTYQENNSEYSSQMSQGIEGQLSATELDTEASQSQESEIVASESESVESESETLQIVMVGDMLMHTRLVDSGKQEDGSYNFDHLFTNVQDFIQSADVAIVNQETIMGGEEYGYSGYPRFNSPYALGDAEVKAGFNIILHATNHTLDKGAQAVLNCMDYWESNHPEVAYVGINRTQEQRDNVYIYEQNGIKVAILNYTYSTNGQEVPSDMPYIVNQFVEKEVIADIAQAEELADFTIVCPHWGKEYSFETNSFQEKWTKIFLENGVDLVIGAHPHVIEPIEWVTDDDGHSMLVYYSIGNYVNGTSSTKGDLAHRMVGGIADVTIGRNDTGEVVILEHDVIPIVFHIAEGDTYTVYYLDDYTEEMAQENRIRLQDSAFSLEACWDVVHQVWGEE